MAALKTLQEKIHRLEIERIQAENDLNCLSREAAQYRKALQQESNEKNIVHPELMEERKGNLPVILAFPDYIFSILIRKSCCYIVFFFAFHLNIRVRL